MENFQSRQMKLTKISTFGQWICVMSLILIIGYCAYIAVQPQEAAALFHNGVPGTYYPPSNSVIYLSEFVAVVPVAIFVATLLNARKMFGLIGSGQFLSLHCQNILRRLGFLALAGSITSIICHSLLVLLITSANPPGQKMLVVGIDSGQISSLIGALLLFTFSLLVKDAAAIADENKQFI